MSNFFILMHSIKAETLIKLMQENTSVCILFDQVFHDVVSLLAVSHLGVLHWVCYQGHGVLSDLFRVAKSSIFMHI